MFNFNQIQPMVDNQMQNQIIPINPDDDFNIFDKNNTFMHYDAYLNILQDQKKKIYLTNPTNKKSIVINIPIYFTKRDLYSYINMDENEERQEAILFYNNNILNNDESSIEDIHDNGQIILFQRPNFETLRNSSLYKYIIKLFPSHKMMNIFIEVQFQITKLTLVLPETIPFSLMLRLIKIIFKIDKNKARLSFCDKEINMDSNDSKKIADYFSCSNPTLFLVEKSTCVNVLDFRGKEVKATIFFKNKNIFKAKFVNKYDPVCRLYDIFLNDSRNNRIFYKGIELKRDDKHSVASLGIKGDFECFIE